MFLRLLAFPFLMAVIGCLYLAWEVDRSYAIIILPLVLVLALLYIFSPQVEWWRAQSHPPQLDRGMRLLLEKYSIFYQSLDERGREKFRNRVVWFIMAKEFHGQIMEQVPEDIKGVVAMNAVHLTFYQEDYLFKKFENIVIYAHPFPSPQYLEHWHTSEIHVEDGAILFSAEHLMPSFLNPQKYYNIGLHEFAKIQILTYSNFDYPTGETLSWEKIEAISGWTEEFVSAWIGLPNIELLPVTIVAYFTFPIDFQRKSSEVFNQLQAIFNKKNSPPLKERQTTSS
ncbi:MAG: zinc-dependent peptidase [Saprospiraceae bacterium]